jgi:chitinase
MFGPPQDDIYHPYSNQVLRPFGHASVDGFDFDFEGPNQNSIVFARQLRQLMDDYTRGAGHGRKFFLSAAPQCQYPEVWMKDIMDGAYLDMVFVQFYNNYCGGKYARPLILPILRTIKRSPVLTFPPVNSYASGGPLQAAFNFNEWNQWARTNSKNKNVKVFVGVPGNQGAGRGYVPLSNLGPIVEESEKAKSFGGVMIWDASQAYTNDGFIEGIKTKLRQAKASRGSASRQLQA